MEEESSVEEWAQPENPEEEPWELPANQAEDPEEEDFGINFCPDPELSTQPAEDQRFNDFLLWEQASRDTIDFKKIYVDITGDLIAGLLLSQIIYWNLPNKEGKTKLRIKRRNQLWLAKKKTDWWEEIRISPKQAARATRLLAKTGIVKVRIFKFKGAPTTHFLLRGKTLLRLINKEIKAKKEIPKVTKGNNGKLPKVTMESDQRGISITKTTTETTNNNNNKDKIGKENPVVVLDFQSLKNGPINFTHSEVQKLCQKTGKSKKYIINRLELAFKTMESFPPRNNPKGWLISSMVDEYDLEAPESSGEVRPDENRQSREHNNQEHRETTASILAMRKESLEDPGAQRFFKLTDKLKNKSTSETIEKEKPVKLREVQEKRKKAEQNKAKAPAPA
ncbi:hypothetical protein ES705_17583 [subsurface metagenome]